MIAKPGHVIIIYVRRTERPRYWYNIPTEQGTSVNIKMGSVRLSSLDLYSLGADVQTSIEGFSVQNYHMVRAQRCMKTVCSTTLSRLTRELASLFDLEDSDS